MKIAIAADHGGFDIKEVVSGALSELGHEVIDLGCHSRESVDYPDFAREVAMRVSEAKVEQGVLVCTTGIGMAIAANKYPRVRAALCLTAEMASTARLHNSANILVMSGHYTAPELARDIVQAWCDTDFSDEERHARRVKKLSDQAYRAGEFAALHDEDPEMFDVLTHEVERQQNELNLIASENTVSRAVREVQGSVMTNKYAEGYPGKRWYNGCEFVDQAERFAIARSKELFGAEHANVQPHCGSSANMAVYFAMLEPGDTILAMSLDHGGHLTHGHSVNFSGRFFNVVSYGVDASSETIDYDTLAKLAAESRPKLIVAGASAYPRTLEFERFRSIADSVGAMLMVDMAHVAGLVAAGAHPSPVPFADFVTSTTHKTLRGPRSGLVLCKEKYAKDLDRQVFPGLQGGPLMHVIAAKAVCFHEALKDDFKAYGRQVVMNAAVMAKVIQDRGFRLVSGGTDNHLMLVDVGASGLTGKEAAIALDKSGLVVNKNTIPFDKNSPFVTSGIRIGTPTVTSRGMGEAEMETIGGWIADVLENITDEAVFERVRADVKTLTAGFSVS